MNNKEYRNAQSSGHACKIKKKGPAPLRMPALEEPYEVTFTSICFGLASSAFGTATVRTPSL